MTKSDFTPRELQVIKLVSKGMTNKAIAQYLGFTPATAMFHVSNIAEKMNVHRRTEIAIKAMKNGLA